MVLKFWNMVTYPITTTSGTMKRMSLTPVKSWRTAAIPTRSAPMVAMFATTNRLPAARATVIPNSLRISSASPSFVTAPRSSRHTLYGYEERDGEDQQPELREARTGAHARVGGDSGRVVVRAPSDDAGSGDANDAPKRPAWILRQGFSLLHRHLRPAQPRESGSGGSVRMHCARVPSRLDMMRTASSSGTRSISSAFPLRIASTRSSRESEGTRADSASSLNRRRASRTPL